MVPSCIPPEASIVPRRSVPEIAEFFPQHISGAGSVALAILSPVIWLRLCCSVGQTIDLCRLSLVQKTSRPGATMTCYTHNRD
jgi:hypothetical protein